ncbi:MAG TPA: CTP synthase [Spirochaetota bacterium]|nr:CTP synthase [Spirochaetota bacterium]HOM38373.1 CTP synthase [Spirochaetota bacterium]HPQ48409.1 CTP synthase [Spirochaetota bacterium]
MDKNKTKYIFITGGVCSSLGKGIAAASLGSLLELRGFKIGLQKIDPYLNVDAGTMSPYQHGEVFVTADGAETDLDLGNYERFTDSPVSKINSITTGQIYLSVINKERRGEYLGKTVQVVPHITTEIKARIKKVATEYDLDILIVEVGGTVGDIESIPFIEAIRQFALDIGKENVLFIHLTLIPYIPVSGELKTKPTQHSVKELGSLGILPDILMCRTSRPLTEEIKEKIAIMTNIEKRAVIQALDISSTIYEIPLQYSKEGLDDIVIEKLKLPQKKKDLSRWEKIVNIISESKKEVKIGVVGKYLELSDAYKSLFEALVHGGIANKIKVNIKKIDSEYFNEDSFKDVNGILIPGGFGSRGIDGKIRAITYARENNIPLFGICLGMQLMVVEFARNILGMKDANSEEFNEDTPYPVISLMEEQKQIINLGGTMRLGTYKTKLNKNSKLYKIYNQEYIFERHRHRFEFNNEFKNIFEKNGMIIAGVHEESGLVEAIEIKDHLWAIGVQFHPEYKSKPFSPVPLFVDFIKVSSR